MRSQSKKKYVRCIGFSPSFRKVLNGTSGHKIVSRLLFPNECACPCSRCVPDHLLYEASSSSTTTETATTTATGTTTLPAFERVPEYDRDEDDEDANNNQLNTDAAA